MSTTKVFLVLDYVASFFILGTIYWLFNGILLSMNLITEGSDLYLWCWYLWHGSLIAIMILGAIYFFIRLREYDFEFKRRY